MPSYIQGHIAVLVFIIIDLSVRVWELCDVSLTAVYELFKSRAGCIDTWSLTVAPRLSLLHCINSTLSSLDTAVNSPMHII